MPVEVSPFYEVKDGAASTHLALRWKGRLRYVIPRHPKAQPVCWALFQPGRLGYALRVMARFPRWSGATACSESAVVAWIRSEIGTDTGLSCLRSGAEGIWHKDTILLLNKRSGEPELVVKAGAANAVGTLLGNEATWLRMLGGQPQFEDWVPQLAASGTGQDLSFLAQTTVSGDMSFALDDTHLEFLRRFQNLTLQSLSLEETFFWQTLNHRIKELSTVLPEAWVQRFQRALTVVSQALSGSRLPVTGAHNDFTAWNIRLSRGTAKVFDWEYAAWQQLPLFDPLHFSLAPMALRSESVQRMERKMHETIASCGRALGRERCYRPREQALAYLLNLCTLYMWADRGRKNSHPTLVSYGALMDKLCREGKWR